MSRKMQNTYDDLEKFIERADEPGQLPYPVLEPADMLVLAERIARYAHMEQTDRSGAPYIGHIERVVQNLLRRWPDSTVYEIAAAWLHDVVEDTCWDTATLHLAGIPLDVTRIIDEVSRPPQGTYLEWIQSLAASGSISAVHVKVADNYDNSSPERVASIPEGPDMLRKRYQPARVLLEARVAASDMKVRTP